LQELYKPQPGFIHKIDARVKLVFSLAFLVFLNITPDRAWPAYILFLTMVFSIALISRLGVGFVLKRSIFFVPFVLAALPLVFTGSHALVPANLPWGGQLSYNPQGIQRFISIAIKSWVSVQAAVLLAATTRFPDLMTSLQQLKVPGVIVATITLMWRYLFVISEEVTRMLRARSSRSAIIPGSRHSGGTLLWRARVTGGMAGSLFLRAIERSERVYAAMLSRGYTGEIPVSQSIPLSAEDRQVLLFGIPALVFLCLLGFITGG